jgi:hypothetical protein
VAPFTEDVQKSMQAFAFQSGIDRIQKAFRASITAMDVAQEDAQNAYNRYVESGSDDCEYEYLEDGTPILVYSAAHNLDLDVLDAVLAKSVVREAFITSAFHFWEVSARQWTGLHDVKHNFERLCNAVDYQISPSLPTINCLNNLLKHNNPERARQLSEHRADYFFRVPERVERKDEPDNLHGNWVWTLRLNNVHVEEVIEVVRASGPQF